MKLSVVDEGPGADEAARGRMFDRDWRGSADGEGRGLGPAFVRAVAERHGGTAWAEPGPSGKGLSVSLTLGKVLEWHTAAPRSREATIRTPEFRFNLRFGGGLASR